MGFIDWEKLNFSIDSGAGAVNKVETSEVLHSLQQDAGSIDVVLVVLKRVFARFSYSFQSGEVSNTVDFMLEWRNALVFEVILRKMYLRHI